MLVQVSMNQLTCWKVKMISINAFHSMLEKPVTIQMKHCKDAKEDKITHTPGINIPKSRKILDDEQRSCQRLLTLKMLCTLSKIEIKPMSRFVSRIVKRHAPRTPPSMPSTLHPDSHLFLGVIPPTEYKESSQISPLYQRRQVHYFL